jgi:N-terminal acetyltransferase B complex non-catalytic subunit
MRAYQRLALKQIQLDTLSYTLFDRISTVHPRAFTSHTPEGGNKTPLQQLQRQQQVYDDAYRQVAKNMWLSVKHGSYNSMYHIKTIEKELSHGLGAAMSVIERRRISRLTEPETPLTAVSHGWDLLGKSATRLFERHANMTSTQC